MLDANNFSEKIARHELMQGVAKIVHSINDNNDEIYPETALFQALFPLERLRLKCFEQRHTTIFETAFNDILRQQYREHDSNANHFQEDILKREKRKEFLLLSQIQRLVQTHIDRALRDGTLAHEKIRIRWKEKINWDYPNCGELYGILSSAKPEPIQKEKRYAKGKTPWEDINGNVVENVNVESINILMTAINERITYLQKSAPSETWIQKLLKFAPAH